MYQGKKIIFVMLLLMTTLLFSSFSSQLKPPKKMQQFYFTKEGNRYELKTVTKDVQFVSGLAFSVRPRFVVNPVNPINSSSNDVQFITTPNGVIPLMCYYAVIRMIPTSVEVMNIATPFYAKTINGMRQISQIKALLKVLPMIEEIYVDRTSFETQKNNSTYGLKYGQVLLSDSDFNDSQESFYPFSAFSSFAISGVDLANSSTIIPAGTYIISQTTLYFELVK